MRCYVKEHDAYLFSRDLQKLLTGELQLPQLIFTVLNLQHHSLNKDSGFSSCNSLRSRKNQQPDCGLPMAMQSVARLITTSWQIGSQDDFILSAEYVCSRIKDLTYILCHLQLCLSCGLNMLTSMLAGCDTCVWMIEASESPGPPLPCCPERGTICSSTCLSI